MKKLGFAVSVALDESIGLDDGVKKLSVDVLPVLGESEPEME